MGTCVSSSWAALIAVPLTAGCWLEGEDIAGNVTREAVVVRVSHDERPGERCLNGSLTPEVEDDDPACVAELPQAGLAAGQLAFGPEEPQAARAGCATAGTEGGASVLPLVALGLTVFRRRRGR